MILEKYGEIRVRAFEYRNEPTSQCPYPLRLTPQPHHVSAPTKIVEMILINNFGEKNIPHCLWWRQSDPNTPPKVYAFQKTYYAVVRRLLKTYSDDIVMSTVKRMKIKFLSPKLIAKYLYWCKITQEEQKRVKPSESRYNKEETIIEDSPVIDIECKKEQDLRDWLD